jgi:3-(methylthio)propionyl---CoA ligase
MVSGHAAMNHHRHVELYYAVSGIGAVLHTVNPRLFDPQLAYVLCQGGARWIFVDPAFFPLLKRIESALPELRDRIVLAPPTEVPDGATSYEDFLASGTSDFDWPSLDERAASALCYTSGTAGNLKGVLYSHRSTVLHALAACRPDSFDVSARSVLLAIPPLFHACAWSFPYVAAMAGAKLVLPGPRLDGASLQALIESEGCTFTVGVPTVFTSARDAHRDPHAPPRGDRRVRGATHHDRGACGIRLRSAPALGDDRGESSRNDRHAHPRDRRPARRGAA